MEITHNTADKVHAGRATTEPVHRSLEILIVTGIFPPDIGGPATYVPTISGELMKRGHTVTVVTLSDALDHDDTRYGFTVHRIRRGMFKPLCFVQTVIGIIRAARRAQILYVNGLFLQAIIANALVRKPMVQKIVGDWAWEYASNKRWIADNFDDFQKRRYGLKVQLLKAARSFWARRANAVIVPSRYLAGAVNTWRVPAEKITVVYNAVEVPRVPAAQIPLRTPVNIVTVGRLVPWKRIDHLIEAIKEYEEVGLVIVGDGPERNRLEQIARANRVADRVFFAGRRSQMDTLGLMRACNLFVLHSVYEGFPHVILEAMGAGLPVVATAVGGTPELVRHGENGILLPPDANGALAGTLGKLLASSDERNRLAVGASCVWQRFRGTEMIGQTEAVLTSCAFSDAAKGRAERLKDIKC